ncbi:hypothetical protein Dda_6965 [Drechslerella dactyloides]|uniref:Uncharacterized protein n=1 Tax=Drechslerella dactyloides TaxID=74499 RepID=A0AAD6NIP3_DREDA|nr:hypothetical protein Dda_6965 [Drechslerella dactyloides]
MALIGRSPIAHQDSAHEFTFVATRCRKQVSPRDERSETLHLLRPTKQQRSIKQELRSDPLEPITEQGEQNELEEEIPTDIDEDIFALPSHSQGYQERSQEHEHQDGARDGDHQNGDHQEDDQDEGDWDEDQEDHQDVDQRQHHDESQDEDHRGREEPEEEIVSQLARSSGSMMSSRTKSAPKKRALRKRGHASNGSQCHPAGHRVAPWARILDARFRAEQLELAHFDWRQSC